MTVVSQYNDTQIKQKMNLNVHLTMTIVHLN